MIDIVGTGVQPYIFLACLGAGALSAPVYGICYVIRDLCGHKKWVELLADLIFMLTAASAYLFALLYSDFAEVRFYTLIGFLCGFFPMYFLLRPLRRHLPKIKEKLRKISKLPLLRKIFR